MSKKFSFFVILESTMR
ncbi:Protein of unknown function [Bacillus mycoides]|nr:Protein of unknown function [Bacillus mycoides]